VSSTEFQPQTSKIASQKPAGTVTFLFSDIEGSTQLLQRLGDKYAQALLYLGLRNQ